MDGLQFRTARSAPPSTIADVEEARARTPSASSGTKLSTDTYERLRAAIVRGEFRPNERLVEAELATRFAVSRTPIRESIQRLAAEGLVANRRRGWLVREHTADEIRELYELRAALEGFAAHLAAERASDEQLARIAALNAQNPRLLRGPRTRVVGANDEFHRAVIAAAGNGRLAETIRQSREHFFNYRIQELYTTEEVEEALAAHKRISDALLRRDGEAAERAAREHILTGLAVILAKLR
jgi:DNA-binding GntR family transcriptional regulator